MSGERPARPQNAPTQDGKLEEARRLDRRGRSRAATQLLAQRVAADPSDPAREQLGEWLLRDGRDAEWLALYARHEEQWQREPRLVQFTAFAAHRLGRFARARLAYTRLLEHGDSWASYAREQLRGIEAEFGARTRAAAARGRAGLLGVAGLFGLGITSLGVWVILRRQARAQHEAAPRPLDS